MVKQFTPQAKSLNEIIYSLIAGRCKLRLQLRDAENTNRVYVSYDAVITYDRERDMIIPKLVTSRPIELKAKHLDRDKDEVRVYLNWELRVDGKVYTSPALREWNEDDQIVITNDKSIVLS